jgi:hypothetical protein
VGHMAVYNRDMEVQKGYDTYSVLLVPEYDWGNIWLPRKDGNRVLKNRKLLLKAFSRFGDIIGKKHLACWFYSSGRLGHGYEFCVDLDVTAVLPAKASTEAQIKKVLARGDIRPQGELNTSIDFKRSRLICAMLGLPYSGSPYVAFFDSYPAMPAVIVDHNTSDPARALWPTYEAITQPKLVLSMKGLSLDGFTELLDQLEQQILREDIKTDLIRWQRFSILLREWCKSNRKGVVRILDKFAAIAARKALEKL